MEKELWKVSQSSVAQALAADYFCIYYVNTDNDKFIEYSSSEEYKKLGLPRTSNDFTEFSLGMFLGVVHPDDRERFEREFRKERVLAFLGTHQTFTIAFRMLFAEGPTHVHLKVTRMLEDEGHHVVIGISSVDEQVKALEAFEKEHNASVTYSRIAQALAEDYFSIYYVDMTTDQFIEYSSDTNYKKLGLEQKGEDFFTLSRRNVRRIMYEEDQGAFLAAFTKENMQRVLDEHRTFTLSYRLIMDGAPTWVSMKATRMKDEDGNHVIIGVNNIDAQMKQQAVYQKAKKDRMTYSRIAQALAADYFSTYVVDPDTDRFVEYSATSQYDELGIEKAGEDFFTLSRRNMERIIYPGDREHFMEIFSKEKLLSITEQDGHFTTKYRLMFGSTPVWVSMKATLLEDSEGRHLIIGTNNIDAQMSREEEYKRRVEEAHRTAKNDFLANMSHDIRTPMNAIVGYTNIAKSRVGDPEAMREALEKIGSSSHFLLSLINDILDISKIESGKMQLSIGPCDLGEILRRIEDITALQGKNKALAISYHRESIEHSRVWADELRIEQVLINIMSNAIKYTPEGKSVDLYARELGPGEEGKNRYRFVVKDTGIGISEEYLPHIFESFTREEKTTVNRVQGTGLGLAITARVVELMGGTISVESRVGEGSAFTVDLSLSPWEGEREEAGEESEPADLTGCRVLLVEDNAINAEIAAVILNQYGMTVDWAENGLEGVSMVRQAEPGAYGVILMDIQMPVMNGYEATKAIRGLPREDAKKVPIIAMSANAYEEDVQECLKAGMTAHIAKPFNPEDLMELLRKHLA